MKIIGYHRAATPTEQDLLHEYGGCKSLAAAVIHKAISDLFKMHNGEVVGMNNASYKAGMAIDYMEAKNFLTMKSGAWSKTRKIWCAMADIDEKSLMGYVYRTMERFDDEG